MKTLSKLRDVFTHPTAFDSQANYMGEIPNTEWLVVMGRTRDSDILTESNWACALETLGGESETVEVFNFGHWACGWIEYLCVKQDTPAAIVGLKIANKIEEYPILDENDFSERETLEADRIWADCYTAQERVDYIREHSSQFEFHNFRDLLGCVRGKYFAGYASELVL